MNREETREFLIRYYRKRSSSFLANIYKASVTNDSRDIHRARLDVKKIFALYGLFEMVDPKTFRKRIGYEIFRPIYRKAGKIREIQVNYLLLDQEELSGQKYESFMLWLREEERAAVKQFLKAVKKFREYELDLLDKEIQKICSSSPVFKLRSKTEAFIRKKAGLVKQLLGNEPGNKEIHKIRQNLKTILTVTSIVNSVKPNNRLDQIISALNKTEMLIGEWHDRVVLKEAIEGYQSDKNGISADELALMNQLKQKLNERNEILVEHFMPEVNAIVDSILII